MTRYRIYEVCNLFAVAVLLGGCSTTGYKEKADAEAYGLILEKNDLVPGMVEDFSIESREKAEFSGFPTNQDSYEFLGDEADSEIGSYMLTLNEALDLAVKHSRSYQSRKEQLFSQALQLSLARHQFDPIFSGNIGATHTWDTRDEFTSLTTSDVVSQTSGSVSTGLGVSKLMKGGGRLAFNLSSNFFRYLTGNSGESASSVLIGSFTQPLLQGAGRKVTMENLTQSERNLLYSLRDFTRFRKEFAVQITSSYYGVLRSKDSARNNYLRLKSFEVSLVKERAFLVEGFNTPGDVARLEQDTLSSDSSWTSSINSYQESLDRFKIQLGISIDEPLVLDDAELALLTTGDPILPGLTLSEATDVALVTRLDLYTEMDQILDAERKIVVAANGMKPRMDLLIESRVNSKDGNRVSALDFQRHEYTVGVDLELPFDRKADRNNYRTSLINLEVARRSADEFIDNVKLAVRNAWRDLEQSNRDYAIALLQVELNVDRVEFEKILSENGEGDIQDLVDAQNALTGAQTSLTGFMVQQRVALLQFWRDVGILYVNEDGRWEKQSDD
ncbi:MAG: TolC family protein [Candidatus Hydrogenedentota bacterium]